MQKKHIYMLCKKADVKDTYLKTTSFFGLLCCIRRCLPDQFSNKKINTYLSYESLQSTANLKLQVYGFNTMSILL